MRDAGQAAEAGAPSRRRPEAATDAQSDSEGGRAAARGERRLPRAARLGRRAAAAGEGRWPRAASGLEGWSSTASGASMSKKNLACVGLEKKNQPKKKNQNTSNSQLNLPSS